MNKLQLERLITERLETVKKLNHEAIDAVKNSDTPSVKRYWLSKACFYGGAMVELNYILSELKAVKP